MSTKVIGLCGEAGSGKDTVANFIKELSSGNTKLYSFAGPVYALTAAMLGTTPGALSDRVGKEVVQIFYVSKSSLEAMNDLFVDYDFDVKYDLFPSVWYKFLNSLEPYIQPYDLLRGPIDEIFTLHISPRKALELVGTELGRELLGTNVWTDFVVDSISKDKPDVAVITDVRFLNEVTLVKEQLGGPIIKVVRKDNPNKIVSSHVSAAGIPDELCEYILENDREGLSYLRSDVAALLEFFLTI